MMFHDELRKRFQGPFKEERVWVSQFEGHTFDRDVDEMETIISDHADRIENTFNCVSMVESHERHTQIGPSVLLALVMSRTADRDLFEASMGTIEHQIMDDLLNDNE